MCSQSVGQLPGGCVVPDDLIHMSGVLVGMTALTLALAVYLSLPGAPHPCGD